MSKHKNHTRSRDQFRKYVEGKMSDRQAHAFERDLLDSEFEQEALEGYEQSDETALGEDLDKLGKQLVNRRTEWYGIAATVAILVAVGFRLWFTVLRPVDPQDLAMQSEKEEAPTTEETVPPQEFTDPGPDIEPAEDEVLSLIHI